jgi:hypothetical protein
MTAGEKAGGSSGNGVSETRLRKKSVARKAAAAQSQPTNLGTAGEEGLD